MANIKDQVAQLLKKEMDRKDFLKYVAAASAMAVGGSIVMQSLGGLDKLNTRKAQSVGYGASAYGGRPKA